MWAMGQSDQDLHEAGATADAGSFSCVDCSFEVSLDHAEAMPTCPNCGGTSFERASLFEQPTLKSFAIKAPREAPEGWLEGVRESIEKPGKYLAFYIDGRARVVALEDGWSRIGRSASADIRIDDPTVSRRHAVIVRTPEGELSALDDRSTNGILVNGQAVDWSPLADGDLIQVGRYTLAVIETAGSERA
jgi:predicted RNA-binding Zn-ribbon protein involved in translation (DUF1610 family)